MLTRRVQAGFTMIEAAVVLTVLGLTMMAVLPEIGAWMRGLRVRNGAESVQNGLQRARVEALRRNQEVTFHLVKDGGRTLTDACAAASDSGSWVVALPAYAGKCGTDPAIVEKFASADGASGVTVKAVGAAGADADKVTFNGFGQVVATGTPIEAITFSLPDAKTLDVRVTAGGLIRMCDKTVGAGDSRACPDAK